VASLASKRTPDNTTVLMQIAIYGVASYMALAPVVHWMPLYAARVGLRPFRWRQGPRNDPDGAPGLQPGHRGKVREILILYMAFKKDDLVLESGDKPEADGASDPDGVR
jgi:hypothetical protein